MAAGVDGGPGLLVTQEQESEEEKGCAITLPL